jgi:hypothetical protein
MTATDDDRAAMADLMHWLIENEVTPEEVIATAAFRLGRCGADDKRLAFAHAILDAMVQEGLR